MAKRAKIVRGGGRRGAGAPRATPARKLAEYRAKRDFAATPEPGPTAANFTQLSGRAFCVQHHLARGEHYDLRLEHAGVLLSWAVPKGPSLNPADKRLAVRTEDHPLAYADFEGVIPSGYGGGIALLWDRGTWAPEPGFEDVARAIGDGELKFALDGVKLKGSYALVRTRGRGESRGGTKPPAQWLLIKHRDAWSGVLDVVTAAPQSVKTFAGHAEILAADPAALAAWERAGGPPVRGGSSGELLRQAMGRARALVDARSEPRQNTTADVAARRSSAQTARSRAAGRPARQRSTRPARESAKSKTLKVLKLPAAALRFGARRPKFSNLDKVLYPEAGFTKGRLIDYYVQIAPAILPHLRGRPVTLKRYPDGVAGKFFFEKRCPPHAPAWVRTARVVENDGGSAINYCVVEDVSTLAWLANLAAIELHVPLATAADPDTPTSMVFDLDPGPGKAFADCCALGLRLKSMLDGVGLLSVAKASGGKGLHVYVPLNTPGVTFEQTRAFAKAAALALEKDDPVGVTSNVSKGRREGRIYVDWAQNGRMKTTVCAFSVRARAEPTVSLPLSWDEVDDATRAGRNSNVIQPDLFASAAMRQVRSRASQFLPVLDTRQTLPG
jgi:bifunctional non-homologous end joining protein LigD